ncbi:response regulator transcription factor [Paenibacillus cremeus]|uniref:Response regulator transcription factor n=1 Tax=Paenibacillus cremeus TaxID=2163881 RepID=A0A559KF50_9BACL|nr:response regulator transcription factor [Paenibacillus cremeus]TVY10753.1 response regulator transcription factor [Paenibacillus cremeus]
MWKIAIVDDDRHVLQGMKRLIPWGEMDLEPVGEAMDGEAGFGLIMEQDPDIVITDIYMPVMNGLDMVDRLRREHFQGKIVILSGYSDFEYARQALRLGVDDYLSKPITVNTLKEVLGRLISELEERNMQTMEKEELQRKLLLYEPFVEQERIRGLVTGNMAAEAPQLPNPSEKQTSSTVQLVMVLEIMRTDRMEGMTPRDWNLFRFAVGNIVKELAAEQGVGGRFMELYGHYMAVLIQVDAQLSEERIYRAAERFAGRIIEVTAEYLRIGVQIGIGTWKQDLNKTADSTEEAFTALHEKRCAPNAAVPVFKYKPKAAADRQLEIRPVRFYQEMADAVRKLDSAAAEVSLGAFCTKLAEQQAHSAPELQQMASELWAIFSYTLYDSGIVLGEAFPAEEVQRGIRSMVTLEQMKAWVSGKVQEICSKYGRNDNLKHKQAVDFLIHYIHEHYSEDIRLSDLADKVFISRNYLSNIFRNATGETFNDYVTRVRMERAKSMILEGKLMIYEIAERVGYKNVPYFTTLFKKHTGRNPTDFVKG